MNGTPEFSGVLDVDALSILNSFKGEGKRARLEPAWATVSLTAVRNAKGNPQLQIEEQHKPGQIRWLVKHCCLFITAKQGIVWSEFQSREDGRKRKTSSTLHRVLVYETCFDNKNFNAA